MSLFERFMVVNKRRHEAAVAELQQALDVSWQNTADQAKITERLQGEKDQLIADGEFRDKRIAELEADRDEGIVNAGKRIAELEAELAPFRADVEAGEAEFGIEPGADGPAAEAGQGEAEPSEAQAG